MTVSVMALSVDCADPEKVAGFWAAVLGRDVSPGATADGARIAAAEAGAAVPLLLFHRVPEPKTVKNRLHLDLATTDAAGQTEWLIGLGAKVLHVFEEDGRHRWTTFADPEGNEFDLVSA
jgi:predicted enzyme related to lactoylglutathione lyase